MTESLRAAAALADKLGGDFENLLPPTEPVIDCDALAADRMELRQIAGVSAGGSLELYPGNYDFGPVSRGPGRLGDGQPDSVGFTLQLDGDLSAVVGPGEAPLRLDDQPVNEPTDLRGRVINAGSARFVVARPRPPRKRDGTVTDLRLLDADPWVLEPIPGPIRAAGYRQSLVDQRRRLHHGPDEVRHRIDAGPPTLWDRGPSHPLFGTAVVAMADVPVRGSGLELTVTVPVAVDLLGSPTMVVGSRRLQLAVVRHALLSLAAATDPRQLAVVVLSDRAALDFARRLPHATNGDGTLEDAVEGTRGRRTLVIVDEPARHARWIDGHWNGDAWVDGRWTVPGFDAPRTSMLTIADDGDALAPDADIVTLVDEATVSVLGCRGETPIDGATPVGFAESMALDLVGGLGRWR